MNDDEYRLLQEALIIRPDIGDIIKGSGGLRKVRWKRENCGKSGGVRVIYYWLSAEDQLCMLYIYKKGKKDNLTPEQVNTLRQIVERWSE